MPWAVRRLFTYKARSRTGSGTWPALASDRYVFAVSLMFLHPVFQRQFVLCQFRKNLRLLIALSQFLFHFSDNAGNPLILVMPMEGLEQIQLRILLDLHPQIIQLLDGGIAGKEIQRPWPELMIFRLLNPMIARAMGRNS